METGPVPFPSTLWTLVLNARESGHSPELTRDRMGQLIERYWKPVYWYLRTSLGRAPEVSMDLTQAFFLHVMETDFLSKADVQRGRFRNFLKASVRNFVTDTNRLEGAARRGGQIIHVTLEQAEVNAADLLCAGREFGPDAVFEREWREAVIRAAVETVRRQFASDGRSNWFETFRLYDLQGDDQATYAEIASRLGVGEDTVRYHLRVARQAFREALRAEIRDTVRSSAELGDEIRALFSWLT